MTHCQHCRRRRINRPRGLCWSCYYEPGVRDCYQCEDAMRRKYANRGVGVAGSGDAPTNGRTLPAEPTSALPGSPSKIEVLAERAAAGVGLWHFLDAKGDEG